MSSRTAEAHKAIRLAWQREYGLVQEGKGTRDWTEEQQKDILNPEKGKAYDENGRAFDGQHMKSVEKYPEYQSNPDNIQFLTRKEHLEAHKGSWQNPTNGYYDPVTKQFLDFGEGTIIPCKIIPLSNPVINTFKVTDDVYSSIELNKPVNKEEPLDTNIERGNTPIPPKSEKTESVLHNKTMFSNIENPSGFKSFFHRVGKTTKKLWDNNKKQIIGGAITLGLAAISKIIDVRIFSNGNSGSDYNRGSPIDESDAYTAIDNCYIDTSSGTERALPCEHTVKGHPQRYHTKDGIKIIEKKPYPRGGKKED